MAKTSCQAKASHRAAQNKYVAKSPKAQAARVAKSSAKSSTKAGQGKTGSQSKNAGSNGGTVGRPRQACSSTPTPKATPKPKKK